MSRKEQPPQTKEEILQNLVMENRMLEGAISELQARIGLVDQAIREFNVTDTTLMSLKDLKKNDEILVPIGGGSYLKARLSETEKVMASIGGGVTSEKTADDTKSLVESQLNEFQKVRSALQNQVIQAAQRIEIVRGEVGKLAGQPKP
ncbi:MAG: prefoldin subunit alpha [Candidatus Bathyarchaeia archaeon]